jgi:hypothetical protein
VKFSLPQFGWFSVALTLAGMVGALAQGLDAEDRPGGRPGLEEFFQLGLPDTRGAKWVMVYVDGLWEHPMLPNDRGGRMGNAWLLREEPDGIVELVVNQSRRIRAQRRDVARSFDGRPGRSAGLPMVHLLPADLEKDMARLAEGVAKISGAVGDEDFLSGSRQVQAALGAGQALLFLAHLQRQGHEEFVGGTLPGVLALAPSPEMTLDAAVSALANGRLARLTDDWIARGDAPAFAKGVEALVGEFSRGWKQRDAAVLLAQRARQPAVSPHAGEPAVAKAAAFLLGLPPDALSLGIHRGNWLLPTNPDPNREAAELGDSGFASADAAVPDPLAPLLAGRRATAAVLARLLDDHRLMRARGGSKRSFLWRSIDASPEERLKEFYDELPRPLEVGEMAATLLEPVLPDSLRNISEGSRTAQTLAWLREIEELSDDQLAWDNLRRVGGTQEDHFRTSLAWLVRWGSDASIEQLREVFLDPAVWQYGSGGEAFTLLPQYLERMDGDTTAFRDKLRVVFKKAIEQARRENYRHDPMGEEVEKAVAVEMAGELKRFDQILSPRGLAELLGEIAASGEMEEAQALFHPVVQMLAKAPRTEAEAQIFLAAAQAKLPWVKRKLLMLTMQMGQSHPAREEAERAAVPAASIDPATRTALMALLDDETSGTDDEFGMGASQTVAEAAAMALVWPRLSPPESTAWSEIFKTLPELGTAALKRHARALASGQPPPARPDAAHVPPAALERLAAEFGARGESEFPAAWRAHTPDEQLALVRHFATLPQWPPALIAAAMTINEVRADPAKPVAGFTLEPWKGRRFDEAARTELTAAMEKLGREGHGISATLSASGPWSGLTLSIRPMDQTFAPDELGQSGFPGLEDKPPVIAMVALYLTSGDQQGGTVPVGCSFPVWKDPALTQAWRAKHLKPVQQKQTGGAPADEEQAEGASNDPTPLETRWQAILARTPDARGPFSLVWFVSIAAENPQP